MKKRIDHPDCASPVNGQVSNAVTLPPPLFDLDNDLYTKKREALTYQNKAIEMDRNHWEKERKKARQERRTFLGLQIIPTVSFYDESRGHKSGEKNWTRFGFDLHPQVSLSAGGLVLLFILLSLVFREQSATFFQSLLNGIGNSFGWLYILAANFFVIVLKKIRLSVAAA